MLSEPSEFITFLSRVIPPDITLLLHGYLVLCTVYANLQYLTELIKIKTQLLRIALFQNNKIVLRIFFFILKRHKRIHLIALSRNIYV